MDEKRLTEMMDGLLQHARRMVPKEQLLPMFVWDDRLGTHRAVGVPFGGPDEKTVALAIVRAQLADDGATGYAFVMEAWVSKNPAVGLPQDDPKRTECVIVGGALADGTKRTKLYGIEVRGRRRRVAEEASGTQEMQWVSQLASLLDPLRPVTKH